MADDLRSILAGAGFSGSSLDTAYAVAMAESGGNAQAFNGNTSTGDQSYGLFQVNMLGAMGPQRRAAYGLSNNEALYDAATNAKVAYALSKGGTDFSPWSTYKRGDYRQYLGQSGATVSANRPSGSSGAGGSNSVVQDFTRAPETPEGLLSNTSDPFGATSSDPFAIQSHGQAPAPNGATGSTPFRDKAITSAMRMLGTPYSWGGGGVAGPTNGFAQGAGTAGFDCSSLMQYAFGQAGFNLPRVSFDQLKQGSQVPLSNLQPGDLVGFEGGSHIALYIGNGQIVEAPHTGATVRVRSLGGGDFDKSAFGIHLHLPGD